MLLYIDPGTGSMLFTILIGVIGAGIYSLRMFWIKLRFILSGGKAEINEDKIPFVIFSDDKRYWNVFEPVCREMDKRGKDLVYMTSSQDDPVFEQKYTHVKAECIGKDNKAFAKLNYVNATILLSTTPGLGVYQWKRSPKVQYYVHMLHAAGEVTMYRMFGIDYYDAVLLSGEYQLEDVRALEKMRNLPPKELVKVGIPYMDEMVERLRKSEVEDKHSKTVLLAPTWGPSGIFNKFGGKIIEVLLKTGYQIIIRPHPQSFTSEKEMIEKLMKEYPASEQLEWNRDNDNFEVLRRADILISDFSGVIFDFSLVYDKPIIYTDPNFDVGIYDAWWLEKPLWTVGALPRLGKELTEANIENLKDVIDSCLADPQYAEGRRSVKAETWEHCGEGAERIVDYLINKYEELTKSEKE